MPQLPAAPEAVSSIPWSRQEGMTAGNGLFLRARFKSGQVSISLPQPTRVSGSTGPPALLGLRAVVALTSGWASVGTPPQPGSSREAAHHLPTANSTKTLSSKSGAGLMAVA